MEQKRHQQCNIEAYFHLQYDVFKGLKIQLNLILRKAIEISECKLLPNFDKKYNKYGSNFTTRFFVFISYLLLTYRIFLNEHIYYLENKLHLQSLGIFVFQVTSKPDLYPLVISYNGDAVVKTSNGSTGYLMVQYFRNFIVRPVGKRTVYLL